MIKTKKQMFIVIGVFALVLFLGGTTYAWFNYRRTSSDQQLIAGEIYMHFNEGTNQISLTNVFPETAEEARARNDNYITFTVDGLNTSNKTIYYEFILDHGDDKASPTTRYRDEDLRFDLVELDATGHEVKYLLNAMNYGSLVNKRIYVDTIVDGTYTEEVKRYKLRMWLDENVIISDSAANATYSTAEYKNKYATIKLTVAGDFIEKSANAYGDIKKKAVVNNQINFSNSSSSTNGEGLYVLYGTTSQEYPIYYYRGNINNNNVIFGDYCWQIVRTTDTGGIKMIYNGEVTGNGKTCENTTHATRVLASDSNYNSQTSSMSDVGYMHNKRYPIYNRSFNENVYYGRSVEYGDFDNNGTYEYRLYDDGNDSLNQEYDATHHYSCNSSSATATCVTVRYIYYHLGPGETDHNYIELTGGEIVEDAIYKMTGYGTSEVKSKLINQDYNLNENDSSLKSNIEDWFKTYLTNEVDQSRVDYRRFLEDTTFCNGRDFKTVNLRTNFATYENSGWNPIGTQTSTYIYFEPFNRYINGWYSTTHVPKFNCVNITDQFRVNNEYAKLNYPVGLLGLDEVILAGISGDTYDGNTSFYLYTGGNYWLFTPHDFNYNRAFISYLTSNGKVTMSSPNDYQGVRPVISLKYGVEFEKDGDGTPTNPYVVKYN